jgi:ABC-type multidrug transport system fused ATPase/permease subunit
MLTILKWISELPHALYDGLIFSHLQVLLVYLILTVCIIFLFSKQKAWFFAGIIMFIILQISALNEKHRLLNQQIVQIYNSKNNIVHLINGRTNYVFSANHQPITDLEIKMIENVKNHLKLDKPKLLDINAMDEIKTEDLKITRQSICFLNCRINISKRLTFEISEKDTDHFIQRNKWLANEIEIITTIKGENSYSSGKQISVLTFTTGAKKSISVSLN